MTARKPQLVRYVSPFGSPAWMTREEAARHLAADDARWCRLQDAIRETGDRGIISPQQREIGAPRIEVH